MARAPILVATGSAENQETLLAALGSFSLRDAAVVAHDADGAIAYLKDGEQALPTLVLLDELEDEAAVLALMRTESRLRHTPVIVLSSDSANVARAYEAGANSFIRKPTSRSHLNEALYQIIRYWVFLNQSA
jgi:CheY-like chemotaxis protein